MEWGAAQIALAIAGALFLCSVVASAHPRLALSLASRVTLSIAAGAYVAAATGFGRANFTLYEPLLWLVPVTVAVAVTRDVASRRQLRSLHVLPRRHPNPFVGNTPPAAAGSGAFNDVGEAVRAERAKDPAASSTELEEIAYTLPEARSAVAAHAATPASVLSWLASHGDEAVIDAIVLRDESSDSRAPER